MRLHKRGRMLVAPYEAIRFQRLDLFAVTLRQIGAYIGRMHLEDAVKVLKDGDGNNNAAKVYEVGSNPIGGTRGYSELWRTAGLLGAVRSLYHEHHAGEQ